MTDEETSRRFAALEERIAALEERMNAPPVTINMRPGGLVARRDVAVFPGGFVPAHDVSDEVRTSLRACHVDHDACSAEQRSSAGQAAQGPCERGVVDLREVVGMLVKADEYERKAAALDPFDSMRRAPLMYEAKGLRREAESRIKVWGARVVAERDAANAKAETMRKALANALGGLGSLTFLDGLKRVREMGVERDAMRHELAEMRAELERERVRRMAAEDALSKSTSGERRKWAVAIASALDGADRSGCESFVSCEEMAASVAAMRAELERERKLRRESEEAFKTASDPRNEEARRRGLVTGARVCVVDNGARGTIVGWDEDGDPAIEFPGGTLRPAPCVVRYESRDIKLEATT